MTEKRFTFADGFKIVAIRDNGNIMNSKQVCNKLNELYEENGRLTQKNEELKLELDSLQNKKNLSSIRTHKKITGLMEENKELKKQLRREETDKKRLMSYLMRYKGFGFDEIVEDFFDNPYYDNWWEDGFYECCWNEYLKEKGFNGCDEECVKNDLQ